MALSEEQINLSNYFVLYVKPLLQDDQKANVLYINPLFGNTEHCNMQSSLFSKFVQILYLV